MSQSDNNEEEVKDLSIADVIKSGAAKGKTIGAKISDKVENTSKKLIEKQKIKSKKDFNIIKEEANADTSANYLYMMFAPLIGFTVSPALYLLALDINEDQLEVIKLALIGNAIGLVLTVILLLVAFRDGIRKSIMSVYRHFYTKKEVSDLELAHFTEIKVKLEENNKELKEKVEQLNKDLFEYNIDQEIKKRKTQ